MLTSLIIRESVRCRCAAPSPLSASLHTWPVVLNLQVSGAAESVHTVSKQMDMIWLPHLNKMSPLNTICPKHLHFANSAAHRGGEICCNASLTASNGAHASAGLS